MKRARESDGDSDEESEAEATTDFEANRPAKKVTIKKVLYKCECMCKC